MLTVFFDWEGIVHHKYTLEAQRINKEYYLNIFHQLRATIQQKLLQLWRLVICSFIMTTHPLMYHVSCGLFAEFLVKHQITQVTQPHYKPGLAPCDFWLFPKLKSPLKGERFQTTDEVQENMTGQLMAIGRTV